MVKRSDNSVKLAHPAYGIYQFRACIGGQPLEVTLSLPFGPVEGEAVGTKQGRAIAQ